MYVCVVWCVLLLIKTTITAFNLQNKQELEQHVASWHGREEAWWCSAGVVVEEGVVVEGVVVEGVE